MSIKQLIHESIKARLEESRDADYEAAKKRAQKIKKGSSISFLASDGKKKTGEYQGLINRGGRSYAKVEMGKPDGMAMVPVTQIQEQAIIEAKYDYADMVSWVGDKMENTDMNIDQMRTAFVKKFGRNSLRYFDSAVDELS